MAHGSCARLGIRSRASDCHLTDRHVRFVYRGSQPHHYNRNWALRFLSLSTQPVTNSLKPGTHEQHTTADIRRRVLVLLMPAKASRPASIGRENSIRPSSRSRDAKTLKATKTCSSTRLEGVSVRKAAWWLQTSNLKTLAPLLRFAARSNVSRLDASPRTRVDHPSHTTLRGTRADYSLVVFHELQLLK